MLAVVLAGCGGPAAPASSPPVSDTPVVTSDFPPEGIEIPKLGVRSNFVVTGIQLTGPAAGTLEVPPVSEPMQASYYEHAPRPGDVGPAIVLAHVNGRGQPGFFARLGELSEGDEILIERQGGPLTFRVYETQQVDKDAFPWDQVVAPTNRPELRLITCTGAFVGGAQGYEDNLIVSATLN